MDYHCKFGVFIKKLISKQQHGRGEDVSHAGKRAFQMD